MRKEQQSTFLASHCSSFLSLCVPLPHLALPYHTEASPRGQRDRPTRLSICSFKNQLALYLKSLHIRQETDWSPSKSCGMLSSSCLGGCVCLVWFLRLQHNARKHFHFIDKTTQVQGKKGFSQCLGWLGTRGSLRQAGVPSGQHFLRTRSTCL